MNDDAREPGRVEKEPDIEIVAIEQSPQNEAVTINQPAAIPSEPSPVVTNQSSGVQNDDVVVIDQSEEPHSRKPRAKETRRRRGKGLGGLQLEKTGIWTLRCIINGKRVSKSTGTRDRAEAEQFAKRFLAPYVKDDAARTFENIQAAVMTERQLAEMREAEGPQLKLSEAWEAYEASPLRRDLAQATLEGKKQVCRKFIEYMNKVFPEVVEVRHLARYHTENYLNYLRKDHSASTYNNRLCVLREVHRTLMKRAAAKENPWEGFPLRADDSHTRRELTIEELARLVDMASREGPEFRTLFGIAMYTGLRLGDCCKLTWAEVDIVRSIIQKIPEKTKKYRKGRPVTIPIHKVLADLLVQTPIERRTGYVLPTIGPWAASGQSGMGKVHHRIGKIFKNAGIVTSVEVEGRKWKAPEASFHSLRHTFVSMSANAGVPLHIVQSIVGHESTAMTRHYYHENVSALQKAVEAIPSISETGDVSAGEVAPPDGSRLYARRPQVSPMATLSPPVAPQAPRIAPQGVLAAGATVVPAVPPDATQGASGASGGTGNSEYETEEVIEAETVISADGVERANPHVEAPLVGRSAEKNAMRRENKLATVEAANADAKRLGGWGDDGSPASQLPALNRRQRNEWIGRCVRRWCQQKKAALLEGTTKLVGNGGYRFLQELWEQGTPMTIEAALDALEVYLQARG